MANEQGPLINDDTGIDIVHMIGRYGSRVWRVTVIATVLAAGLGLAYFFWGQDVRRVAILEFRPTFSGVDAGAYPNGLPFAGSDIVEGSIVDAVFDANGVEQYCLRANFRTGFYVEERSDRSGSLDAEYQAKLADRGLSPIERQTLQAEYQAKRGALPNEFRLVFASPAACRGIPKVILSKVMSDVLVTWANDSEQKRGVLKHQVEVLTPAILDVGAGVEPFLVLRADLVRRSILRVVANIRQVRGITGAALVRSSAERLTFQEIENKLTDLVRARLEPLVISAGQSMAMESETWVTETLAVAERDQRLAEGVAAANQLALQEYSGIAQAPEARKSSSESSTGGSDVRSLTTQVDTSFVDRIVAMSEANTIYRQKLTDAVVAAKLDALEAESRVSYYKRFLDGVRQPRRNQLSTKDVNNQLTEIVDEAKGLTQQFNNLYDEFTRVALRPASGLYQTKKPVTVEVHRSFTFLDWLVLTGGAFIVTLLLAFAFFIIRDRLRDQPVLSA